MIHFLASFAVEYFQKRQTWYGYLLLFLHDSAWRLAGSGKRMLLDISVKMVADDQILIIRLGTDNNANEKYMAK